MKPIVITAPTLSNMTIDRSDECQAAIADALQTLLSRAQEEGWVRAEVLLAIADFSRRELVMLVKEDVLGVDLSAM